MYMKKKEKKKKKKELEAIYRSNIRNDWRHTWNDKAGRKHWEEEQFQVERAKPQ
jgi:hypothetical protein